MSALNGAYNDILRRVRKANDRTPSQLRDEIIELLINHPAVQPHDQCPPASDKVARFKLPDGASLGHEFQSGVQNWWIAADRLPSGWTAQAERYAEGQARSSNVTCMPDIGMYPAYRVPLNSLTQAEQLLNELLAARGDGQAPGQPDLRTNGRAPVARSPLRLAPRGADYRTWYKPILEMPFDDPDQPQPRLFWPNNLRVALPWSKVWLTATSWQGGEKCSVWLVEGGKTKTLLPLLHTQVEEILPQLPPGSIVATTNDGHYPSFERHRLWTTFADEDEKKVWIAETLNGFVNVFRPLLKDLSAQSGEA